MNDSQLSEAILAAQDGDEDAFRMLYRATQPLLHRYLWVLVGEAAEDVSSEAWMDIVRDLPSFRGDYKRFRGWAATLARNRASHHLRRRDVPLSMEDLTADAIATQRAIALIARLPRDQAEAVMLRAVMGLDTHAAGRVLGKRPGAIRANALRGLRRLAEFLRAAPGAGHQGVPHDEKP